MVEDGDDEAKKDAKEDAASSTTLRPVVVRVFGANSEKFLNRERETEVGRRRRLNTSA